MYVFVFVSVIHRICQFGTEESIQVNETYYFESNYRFNKNDWLFW
jgi:hypothetical protein